MRGKCQYRLSCWHCLGYTLSMLIAWVQLFFTKQKVKPMWKGYHFEPKMLSMLISYGLPSFIMNALGSFMVNFVNVFLVEYWSIFQSAAANCYDSKWTDTRLSADHAVQLSSKKGKAFMANL